MKSHIVLIYRSCKRKYFSKGTGQTAILLIIGRRFARRIGRQLSPKLRDLLSKLSLDRSLVDHRPDGGNLGSREFIEDVFGKRDPASIDPQTQEVAFRGAIECKAGGKTRRFADQQLNLELQIRDVCEVLTSIARYPDSRSSRPLCLTWSSTYWPSSSQA